MYAFLQQQAQPFADTPNRVIRRLIGLDTDIGGDEPVPLTRAQRAVLAVLRTDTDLTAAEAADAAGIGYSTAGRVLTDLEHAGMARRERPTGGARGRARHRWRLADHNDH
ncbi:MarR family transcriptional regulator [Actinomadura sp. SCN-SB]|uniref:MarR family transcriptional regulator n=1 Tax=Actinomadura sp. SCN-SB TaxID=3373092 RepID=UPI00375118D6